MQLNVQNGGSFGFRPEFMNSQRSHPLTIASDSFPGHSHAPDVSPVQTPAIGTLSINCIGTRQYVVVGMNLACLEQPNLVIHG